VYTVRVLPDNQGQRMLPRLSEKAVAVLVQSLPDHDASILEKSAQEVS